MSYAFTLTTTIPASAQDIYDAWLDSLAHSEMTGGRASMSDEIDAEVSAWDGYITGRNLELVPGERIVQSWRTTQFTDEHADSIITMTFEDVENGTLLTLVHSNVPDGQTSYEQGGWQEYYFEPMKEYFAELNRAPADRMSKTAGPKAEPKRAPASPKSKRPAPGAKTAARRKKFKHAAPGRAERKRAKKIKSEAPRGKRRR
jgi:uncharacterized protein YndB with AHSA1/START domain